MEAWVYVVLLGAFIVVMAWIRPKNTTAVEPQSKEQLEQILDAFLLDMENENQKWHREWNELRQQYDRQIRELTEKVEHLERSGVRHRPEPTGVSTPQQPLVQSEADSNVTLPPVGQGASEAETPGLGIQLEDRYQQIFKLAKQGKTIHFISKKTGYPKGEVELILQLAKQGDPS